MTGQIDETRHFRTDDKIEFAVGKRVVTGHVVTYRLVPGARDEEQLLTLLGDDGTRYENVEATGCKLVGRKAAAGRGAVAPVAPRDLREVALKAVSLRGATTIPVNDLVALARDYLTVRAAFETAAETDRSKPYAIDEPREIDGVKPPAQGRWLTPREMKRVALDHEVPR